MMPDKEGMISVYYPRLRDLREDKDLTQTQLVEILKMHKTTYTNYEQGKREIPFSSFQRAEFGIGSGQLWLQCIVDGNEFIFCSPRKSWKSPAAKLLLQKIGEQTEILSMKEYDQYTGKLFFIYMFK